MEKNSVIQRITNTMIRKDISKIELAEKLEWAPSKISKILNGDQRIKTDDLIDIALALKTNPALLIADDIKDLQSSEKETYPIGMILGKIHYFHEDQEALVPWFEVYLPDAIDQKIGFKEDGKTIDTAYRNKRIFPGKNGNHSSAFSANPRVVIEDKRAGQVFSKRLSVGYWFSKDYENAYLAIHIAPQGFSVAGKSKQLDCIRIQDLTDYFKAMADEIPEKFEKEIADYYGELKSFKLLSTGFICGVRYSLKEISSYATLVEDLQTMYDIYNRILEKVSSEVTKRYEDLIENNLSYMRRYDSSLRIDVNEGSVGIDNLMKKDINNENLNKSGFLDARKKAFRREEFTCENDQSHKSFISKENGKPFMEGHLLVPKKYQNNYPSVDLESTPENIICLCPMCNAMIGEGIGTMKEELLMKLYLKHREGLKKAGIEVSMIQLLKWYGLE